LRVTVSETSAELEGTIEVGDRGREVALGEERVAFANQPCDTANAPRPDSSQESLRATRAASRFWPSAA
jgi:hypothetical protein